VARDAILRGVYEHAVQELPLFTAFGQRENKEINFLLLFIAFQQHFDVF